MTTNTKSKIILKYITDILKEERLHLSSCMFPEEECSCNFGDIGYDTSLIKGGYMDSFSMVDVLVFIEAKFGVKIPDSDAVPENFDTVNKIAKLI